MSDILKVGLVSPVKVTKEGKFVDSFEVAFFAPTYNDNSNALVIQQAFMRSATSIPEKLGISKEEVEKRREDAAKDAKSDEVTSWEEVKFILQISPGSIDKVFKAFQGMVIGSAEIEDGVKLQKTHLERMPLKQAQELCYRYIAHFLA